MRGDLQQLLQFTTGQVGLLRLSSNQYLFENGKNLPGSGRNQFINCPLIVTRRCPSLTTRLGFIRSTHHHLSDCSEGFAIRCQSIYLYTHRADVVRAKEFH